MKQLILVTGQGSSGKSYYCKKAKQIIGNDCNIVTCDDFANYCEKKYGEFDFKIVYDHFVNETIDSLKSDSDCILLDICLDTVKSRKKFFDIIKDYLHDIDLYVISLRPGASEIVNRQKIRMGYMTDEYSEKIISVYNHFQTVKEAEFLEYGFNSINLYTITSNELFFPFLKKEAKYERS